LSLSDAGSALAESQLAALQRRMSEVESQLALALGSEGTPSVGDGEQGDEEENVAGWAFKGEQVDEERLREMQERIDRCASISLPLLCPSLALPS